jgi:SAM-dependent methyltransferase
MMAQDDVTLKNNPATLRTTALKERVRARLFSNHLRRFPKHDKTLDIGSGWGFSRLINPNFYCVDADVECIDYLKSIGANAYLADITKRLPFADAFFDNAFTHDVLEHLEASETDSVFAEAHRILKPGGLFMNVVPNRRGYEAGVNPLVGHKRFIRVREIEQAAAANGFELVRSWHTPLPAALSELFVHNKLVTLCRAL